MSDQSQGHGWWQATDGKWYPPERHPEFRPSAPEPPPPVVVQQPHGCLWWLGLAVAAVVLLLIGAGVVGALAGSDDAGKLDDRFTPAGNDDGVSMSLEEFNQISNGMTLADVEAIVGGPGALNADVGSGAYSTQLYSWDGDGTFGANANVSFQDGKVISKAQFGLR